MKAAITGAASGMGLATARQLADQGAELLLVDVVADSLADVGAELGAETLAVDLARPDCGELVAAAARERLDGLDALVSNAGIVGTNELRSLSLEEYERTFAINTRATWLLAKELYPLLSDGGGALVATASIASTTPAPPLGVYAASKAALVMLVRQLAYEWGPDGIRCNCVSPGTTATGMTAGSYSDPDKRSERASQIPLRRVADPEDIASVIVFLLGPGASYVTGQNVVVDGGLQTVLLPAVRGLTDV